MAGDASAPAASGSKGLVAFAVLLGAAAVTVGILVLGAPEAEATHFRAGTMQWDYTSTLPDLGLGLPPIMPSVNLTLETAMRRSYPWSCAAACVPGARLTGTELGAVYWGDTTSTTAYEGLITEMDIELDMIFLRFVTPGTTEDMRHQYPTGGASVFTAYWGSCCRLSQPQHRNNFDDPWRLQTIVDLTDDNNSPIATLIPIRQCPYPGTCTFDTYASDADGDPMEFRMSTSAESTGGATFYQPGPCAGTCGSPASSTINPNTGQVTWITTGAVCAGNPCYYSMQIMITDGQAVIPLDYFIRLDPPEPAPTCSPEEQQVYTGDEASLESSDDDGTWSSPGGSPESGSGQYHNTTYDEPGTYNVTVSNSGGSTTCQVEVRDRTEPVEPTLCAPANLVMYAGSTATFYASGGSGKYRWQALGGNPSASGAPSASNPNQYFTTTFSQPGSYSVEARSLGTAGMCSVKVEPYPPPACSPASQTIMVDGVAGLTASGGDGQVYEWQSSDGQSATGSSFNPSFAGEGMYTVLVMSAGQQASCTVTVKEYPPPSSGFSPNVQEGSGAGPGGGGASSSTGCGPRTVTFVDNSSSPNGEIVAWHWEFGDGATSNERNPVHVYGESGTYQSSLRVTDEKGRTAVRVTPVTIDVEPCDAGPQAPHEAPQRQESLRDGGVEDLAGADHDEDGVDDGRDNCPGLANPAVRGVQPDIDMDGFGDACDADKDGDGVANGADNCEFVGNADQADADGDGRGDACQGAGAAAPCPGVLVDGECGAGVPLVSEARKAARPVEAVPVESPQTATATAPVALWAVVGLAILVPGAVIGLAAWRRK